MSEEDKKITLMVSDNMDSNKKPERNEDNLIRLSAAARNVLNFDSEEVEITYKGKKKPLKIFQAYTKDIKQLNKRDKELHGFVTTETLKKLADSDSKLLKNVIIHRPKIEPKEVDILIGTDPEFLLFDNEQVVRANGILPKVGKLGSDGPMIEVRPDPSNEVPSLIKNINDILSEGANNDLIRNYLWKASIYHKDDHRDYPVGGHIHIGNSTNISKLNRNEKLYLFSVLNKIIDELLSLPLIKLDGVELGKSRRSECQMAMGNNGYGFFGEWRECGGYNNERLEHRTLSGLWLMHPVISECVIGTAKAIAEEVFKIMEENSYKNTLFKHPNINLGNHRIIYRPEFDEWENIEIAKILNCTNSSSYMAAMLNSSNAKSINKAFLNKWYDKMKNLSTYKKYSRYIDKLYEILSLPRNQIIKVGFDIKKNWLEETKLNI